MSDVRDSLADLRRCIDADRLAHGYIVVGSPQREGKAFTVRALQLLLCTAADPPCGTCASCRRIGAEKPSHPDVVWLEPRSKGRQILIEEIRHLNQRIATTSYEGGWKAGVILSAECMKDAASNAFLKTLEEPPPRSLLLLVTDSPQTLLPTLSSRCHRIVLPSPSRRPEGEWMEALTGVLRDGPPRSVMEAMSRAGSLSAIMDEIKKRTEKEQLALADPDEDEEIVEARIAALVREEQQNVMTAILFWHRDVLIGVINPEQPPRYFAEEQEAVRRHAAERTRQAGLACVEAVEKGAERLLRRNIKHPVVIEQMMIAFGRALQRAK